MTATLIHQFASEGRISLGSRLSNLMPTIPLAIPAGMFRSHHTGPSAALRTARCLSEGGRTAYLWRAYSNTAYNVLGSSLSSLAKPLHQFLGRLLPARNVTHERRSSAPSASAMPRYEAATRLQFRAASRAPAAGRCHDRRNVFDGRYDSLYAVARRCARGRGGLGYRPIVRLFCQPCRAERHARQATATASRHQRAKIISSPHRQDGQLLFVIASM
jgi:hypothetical protein